MKAEDWSWCLYFEMRELAVEAERSVVQGSAGEEKATRERRTSSGSVDGGEGRRERSLVRAQ